jgi:AcrR family transcriptional regulator
MARNDESTRKKRELKPTEVRRAEIHEVAARIITTRGIAGLSMSILARAAGMVQSNLYRHFKSKEEIVSSLFNSIIGTVLEKAYVEKTPDAPPLEKLERIFRHHMDVVKRRPVVARILFSSEAFLTYDPLRKRIQKAVEIYLSTVRNLLIEGQRQGSVRRDLVADMMAQFYLGSIQVHLLTSMFGIRRASGNTADERWAAFHALIAPPRGASS